MNGILIINKEKGRTSRDIVNDVVHIFNTKKVGHTGTLDPIATGVLVVTIGRYNKLGDALTSTYKEYVATMEFGKLTDTLDNTGNIIKEEKLNLTKEQIEQAILSFQKEYIQEVPIYSAVKVNGRKLYEYARNNEAVELPKKPVKISQIEVLEINENIARFKCLVSKGTYIRSLIRDIADSLGTCAIMTDLIRTKQGKFNIEDSYTIEEVRNSNYKLLNIEDCLDIEKIEMNDNLYFIVNNGGPIQKEFTKEYILYTYKQKEIALYKYEQNEYKMYIKIDI